MEDIDMKPGDKVWLILEEWCSVGDIVQGEVEIVDKRNNQAVVKFPGIRMNPRYVRLDLIFPTREALCEHYRKIFE